MLNAAKKVTRRVPDANRAECRTALHEIVARAASHPGELGDLGPDPDECAAIERDLARGDGCIARLESLLEYYKAKRSVVEEKAIQHIDNAYEQVDLRTRRGRIPAESYANVRRFGDAHGEAVSQGRARAQQMRAKIAAKANAPANDANDPGKTGTNDV